MPDDKTPNGLSRPTDNERQETDRRTEQSRSLAEEARVRGEHYREHSESARQEQEALRQTAEEKREAAEEMRQAAIASVAATADALSTSLARMQFLHDAWNTLRQLKPLKPDDMQ